MENNVIVVWNWIDSFFSRGYRTLDWCMTLNIYVSVILCWNPCHFIRLSCISINITKATVQISIKRDREEKKNERTLWERGVYLNRWIIPFYSGLQEMCCHLVLFILRFHLILRCLFLRLFFSFFCRLFLVFHALVAWITGIYIHIHSSTNCLWHSAESME